MQVNLKKTINTSTDAEVVRNVTHLKYVLQCMATRNAFTTTRVIITCLTLQMKKISTTHNKTYITQGNAAG